MTKLVEGVENAVFAGRTPAGEYGDVKPGFLGERMKT